MLNIISYLGSSLLAVSVATRSGAMVSFLVRSDPRCSYLGSSLLAVSVATRSGAMVSFSIQRSHYKLYGATRLYVASRVSLYMDTLTATCTNN